MLGVPGSKPALSWLPLQGPGPERSGGQSDRGGQCAGQRYRASQMRRGALSGSVRCPFSLPLYLPSQGGREEGLPDLKTLWKRGQAADGLLPASGKGSLS